MNCYLVKNYQQKSFILFVLSLTHQANIQKKNEGLIQLITFALKNIEPHLKNMTTNLFRYKNASLDATNSVSLMTFAKSFISPYFTASNSLLADDMQFTNFKA